MLMHEKTCVIPVTRTQISMGICTANSDQSWWMHRFLWFCVWSLFCNILGVLFSAEKERAGCFILIVFLLSCGCYFSVSLPYSVLGLSSVCDCGISWSYSLTFY